MEFRHGISGTVPRPGKMHQCFHRPTEKMVIPINRPGQLSVSGVCNAMLFRFEMRRPIKLSWYFLFLHQQGNTWFVSSVTSTSSHQQQTEYKRHAWNPSDFRRYMYIEIWAHLNFVFAHEKSIIEILGPMYKPKPFPINLVLRWIIEAQATNGW